MSNKVIIGVNYGSYTFNAATKQITLSGVTNVNIKNFLLVINVTNNVVIYSPLIALKGGDVSGNVLTLDFDTTSMSNTDNLQVHYDLDGVIDYTTSKVSVSSSVIPAGASTEATLLQVRDYLDTVETKLASLITNTTGLTLEATQIQVRDYLDTVETKLASLITNTTGLSTEVTLALAKTALDNIYTKLQSTISVTQSGVWTVAISNPTTNPETGLAKDGTDITSPTAMPVGGVGIRGWLSAIWTKLNGSLAVTGTFFQATQPVSAASLPLPTGAATETTLSAVNTKLPSGLTVTAGKLQVELPAGGTGLTNTELRAAAVPVSLTSTTVTNTVVTSLASTTITGSVAVTGPLTDAQLRAATVPISGTVITGGLTDTQIRASALPVSIATMPTTPVTGAFFPATQPVSLATNTPVIAAGTAIIGKVGIDQTTPGVTNGIQITSLSYPSSIGNNSVAQLASGATFTGSIESILSLQAAQVMITCDQSYNVFIDQFIDLAGTKLVATYTFTKLAGVPLNENITLPGNYFRVRVTNTGASITTTFQLDTTFGIMNTQPNTLSNFGNLRVVAQENGVVSTINSTSVNLASNATFTGVAEDVSEFSMIMVTIFSSHISAVDGLSVQFSSDGTNWDLSDAFSIPAATGKVFSFGVLAKFFRVVYNNSATLTTSLRIQSLFSRTVKKASSQRPSDGRANENDFEESSSYLMGYNGTTWDRLRSSVTNGLAVDIVRTPTPSTTYSVAVSSITPAVTATDLVTIYGSSTKTINILNIWVTGVQTTAGQAQFVLVKRSTANAGGTSTAPVKVVYDSLDAAATAVILAYTANPTTLGTSIGNVKADRIFLPGAASASDAQGLLWSFVNGKQMILRGAAQGIGINLNGVTIAGGSINVNIEWTET